MDEKKFMERHNYLAPIDILRDYPIYEYDMQDAGFTIIKRLQLLPQDIIDRINHMEKLDKSIYIGKLMAKKEYSDISKSMMEEFRRIRKLFAIENEVEMTDVLSIKKDAIFLIEKKAKNTIIDGYKFNLKNSYTSFYKLNKEEFYVNSIDNILHVKGLNKDVVKFSEDKFLKYLKESMIMIESIKNKRDLINILRRIQEDYIEGNINLEYYRELNNDPFCKFHLKKSEDSILDLYSNTYDGYFEDLDISHNYLNYLLLLIQLVLG